MKNRRLLCKSIILSKAKTHTEGWFFHYVGFFFSGNSGLCEESGVSIEAGHRGRKRPTYSYRLLSASSLVPQHTEYVRVGGGGGGVLGFGFWGTIYCSIYTLYSMRQDSEQKLQNFLGGEGASHIKTAATKTLSRLSDFALPSMSLIYLYLTSCGWPEGGAGVPGTQLTQGRGSQPP
jgi:hypothetical protein